MLHGLICTFYVLEFGVFSLCIMFSFLTHRLFRRVCLNFQISGWFFQVYLLMIDFCLKANTLISKQKHPLPFIILTLGGILLSAPTPNLLRVSVSPFHRWETLEVTQLCVSWNCGQREEGSPETQFFLVLKFSSATISLSSQSQECEQIRALALAEG